MDEKAGVFGDVNASSDNSFSDHIAKYIGKTVTIFTRSGGQSGSGFTGVVLSVNCSFVRLLSRIGPPPGCSLGNACSGFGATPYGCGVASNNGMAGKFGPGPNASFPGTVNGAFAAGGWDSVPVYTVGSITDIPLASIVSFVHDAI